MEILLLFIIMYFLPSILAGTRQHNESGTIFMLNLLLGWTVIAWIITFFWSLGGNTKRKKKRIELPESEE